MTRRGVDYSVIPTASPGIWKWQFQIGDQVKTGKTETMLGLLGRCDGASFRLMRAQGARSYL